MSLSDVIKHKNLHWPVPARRKSAEIAYHGWDLSTGNSQEDIFSVNPVTGHIRRITDDSSAAASVSDRDPAWSPDHTMLAIHRGSSADPESTLYLLDGRTGATIRRLVPGVFPEWYDERRVLFVRQTAVNDTVNDVTAAAWADVYAVDIDTLAVTRITNLEAGNGHVDSMSWHHAKGLAVGYKEYVPGTGEYTSAAVMTVPASRVKAALKGGSAVSRADMTVVVADAGQPDWSPDGKRLAHVYFTQIPHPEPGYSGTLGVEDVAVKDLQTGTTVVITADGPNGTPYGADFGGHDPVFSPDGTRIAFTRGYEDEWSEIWISPSTESNPTRFTDEGRVRFKGGLAW